jgi:hypothetical protein
VVKRVFQMVVLFFAIYAFVFVPLGRKTALEHIRAIAETPAAHQAASELQGGVKRLVHELRDQAQRSTEATDEQIAGSEAEVPAPGSAPAQPDPVRASPGKGRPEAGTKARKGPARIPSREPAASNAPDPSLLDPSNFARPPGVKELRSLGSRANR